MLDDVERRTFLVDPAGENAGELLVGALHVDLQKGAGQPFGFPRRGGFAGAQADDDVLHPHRLAGAQRQVADDPVALVQKTDHRHPLTHRRRADLVDDRRQSDVIGDLVGYRLLLLARGQRERAGKQQGEPRDHASSGVQAL